MHCFALDFDLIQRALRGGHDIPAGLASEEAGLCSTLGAFNNNNKISKMRTRSLYSALPLSHFTLFPDRDHFDMANSSQSHSHLQQWGQPSCGRKLPPSRSFRSAALLGRSLRGKLSFLDKLLPRTVPCIYNHFKAFGLCINIRRNLRFRQGKQIPSPIFFFEWGLPFQWK